MSFRVHKWISIVLWFSIVLQGCDSYTGLSVEVKRDEDGFVFVFVDCRGRPMKVRRVRVSSASEDLCIAETSMVEPLSGKWRYGSRPRNGAVGDCRMLGPGDYQVHAAGGEAGGYRYFRINEKGEVVLGRGSCR